MRVSVAQTSVMAAVVSALTDTPVNAPVAPPKKQPDPDLNLGVASLLGVFNDS